MKFHLQSNFHGEGDSEDVIRLAQVEISSGKQLKLFGIWFDMFSYLLHNMMFSIPWIIFINRIFRSNCKAGDINHIKMQSRQVDMIHMWYLDN